MSGWLALAWLMALGVTLLEILAATGSPEIPAQRRAGPKDHDPPAARTS